MLIRQRRNWKRPLVAVVVGCTVLGLVAPTSPADAARRRRRVARVATTSFAIRVLGDAQSVQAGSSAKYSIAVTKPRNSRDVPSFDVPDVPPGVNAQITQLTPTTFELAMATTPAVIGGSAVYVLRGRLGSVEKTALFRLSITAPPTTTSASAPTTAPGDFALAADTQLRVVAPGETGSFGVRIDRRGFTGPISMKVEGLPAGVQTNFAPDPTQANTNLYVTPSVGTPSGSYVIVITGSAQGLSRSVTTRLVVRRVGAFTFSATPNALSTSAGNNATVAITVNPVSGDPVPPNVTLEASNVPAGVALQTLSTDGKTTQVIVSTSATTPAGVFPITITGRSGTFSRTLTISLTVVRNTPGFGISSSPATLNVGQGSSGTYAITVVPVGGFNGAVAFTVEGLPAGATATTEQTPSGANIKITTSATTVATTYPLKITGENGNLKATIAVSLVVTAPAA